MKLYSGLAALALISGTLALSSMAAAADPIDNPGSSRIQFAAADAPFLEFASTDTVAQNGRKIDGDTDNTGNFFYNGSLMTYGDTGKLVLTHPLEAQLFVTDLTGTIDLTDPAHPFVDWDITAKVRFKNGFAVTQSNCATPSFVIHVSGNPGNVDSTAFTIPKFTLSTACDSQASTIQGYFSLGTSGAKLTLYKIKPQALDVNGNPTGPLTGSP